MEQFDPLYFDLLNESDTDMDFEDGLTAAAAVDRVLASHQLEPERAARLRTQLIAELEEADDYPCPKEFGPTLECRLTVGHKGDHDVGPRRFISEATRKIAETAFLGDMDPEGQRGGED